MTNLLGPRYKVVIGSRDKRDFKTLAECFQAVLQHGMYTPWGKPAKRVRVYDRDPGWLHPIYDSADAIYMEAIGDAALEGLRGKVSPKTQARLRAAADARWSL